MAGIDKIYGTTLEFEEFKRWLTEAYPRALKHLYHFRADDAPTTTRPISNFPCETDRWLWENCPLGWVLDRISEQYDGSPFDDGRSAAFHIKVEGE